MSPRPSPTKAAATLRNLHARSVVARTISPRAGAEAIVHLVDSVRGAVPGGEYAGDEIGAARLFGLFYDYELVDAGTGCAEEVDDAVLEECQRLLDAGRP